MRQATYIGTHPDLVGTTGKLQTWGASFDDTAGKFYPSTNPSRGYLVHADEIKVDPMPKGQTDPDHLRAEPRIGEFTNAKPGDDVIPLTEMTDEEIDALFESPDTWAWAELIEEGEVIDDDNLDPLEDWEDLI